MGLIRLKMILVGPHAGTTRKIRNYQFTQGVCTLAGDEKRVMGAVRYLSSYQAYPEHSDELRQGIARYAQGCALLVAKGDAHEKVRAVKSLEKLAKQHDMIDILGHDAAQAIGKVIEKWADERAPKVVAEAAEKGEADASDSPKDAVDGEAEPVRGDDDADAGATADGPDGGDAAADPPDGAGESAGGDGSQRAEVLVDEVKMALAELDPREDEHWTAQGLPKVSVVSGLLGGIGLTRADIQAADPDLNRSTAGK